MGGVDASQTTTTAGVVLCSVVSIESIARRTMLVTTVLQWTATVVLLSSGGGQCQATYDEERSSCVYTFIVPNGQAEGRCPGRGESMETLRLKVSLSQMQLDMERMKLNIEILQVSLAVDWWELVSSSRTS